LLDTLIGSHPDFVVLEEKPALEAIRKSLDARPGGFIAALTELDESGRSALSKSYLGDVERILGEPVGHRRLLDKLPLNILMLPLIRRIFPATRVIMALRHPADVCLSCFFQEFDYRQSPAMANFLSMQDTVDFYGKVMALWQLYQQALPLEMHTIRYEDLVTDTEARMRALFDFLQCPWDARILEHHREVRRRGTIDTPSYHQVSQPIYTQARYRWRNYAAELAPWLDTLHAWADRLGYQPPPAPGTESDNA
ncbi:MAG: sulfotransferase, partial [Xanthomonadales bacterium]|nr:sulfotransferase [Xanthomonadales bacterium]